MPNQATMRAVVVDRERGLALREVERAAMSSGRPARFSGTCAAISRSIASSRSPGAPVIFVQIGVATGPGLIVFTRIPRGASSPANERAIDRAAALLAA